MRRLILIIVAAAALIGAGVYLASLIDDNPEHVKAPAGAAPKHTLPSNLDKFQVHDKAQELDPNLPLESPAGATTLSAWQGQWVLLNLWATWCAPCVVELPTLGALSDHMAGSGLQVVALSLDRGGLREALSYLEKNRIAAPLVVAGETRVLNDALGVSGLPVTLLINPEGYEVARLVGPANWMAPEMIRFLSGVTGLPEE